ncbi:hypothetical protein GCM10022631_24260 [Deinococcus rubellus]
MFDPPRKGAVQTVKQQQRQHRLGIKVGPHLRPVGADALKEGGGAGQGRSRFGR